MVQRRLTQLCVEQKFMSKKCQVIQLSFTGCPIVLVTALISDPEMYEVGSEMKKIALKLSVNVSFQFHKGKKVL